MNMRELPFHTIASPAPGQQWLMSMKIATSYHLPCLRNELHGRHVNGPRRRRSARA